MPRTLENPAPTADAPSTPERTDYFHGFSRRSFALILLGGLVCLATAVVIVLILWDGPFVRQSGSQNVEPLPSPSPAPTLQQVITAATFLGREFHVSHPREYEVVESGQHALGRLKRDGTTIADVEMIELSADDNFREMAIEHSIAAKVAGTAREVRSVLRADGSEAFVIGVDFGTPDDLWYSAAIPVPISHTTPDSSSDAPVRAMLFICCGVDDSDYLYPGESLTSSEISSLASAISISE